jgi:hypothetical protein
MGATRTGENGSWHETNDRSANPHRRDRKAGVVIAEHVEPGHARDPEQTINRLIVVRDTQDVTGALMA